jgi:polysaccharide export outer membrane protein
MSTASPMGQRRSVLASWMTWVVLLACAGCKTGQTFSNVPAVPNEANMASLPEYVISPPDELLIDAVRLVPRPPYRIAPLDALVVQVHVLAGKEERRDQLIPGQPIAGVYRVEPEGTINLGFDYGVVGVAGKTVPEAREQIKSLLARRFRVEFDLTVELAESRAMQQVRGAHLVQPDGRVTLGIYGRVHVAGKTIEQAKEAIQLHLAQFVLDPEISLDVAGFNSKVYYVIYNLDGAGEQVARLPMTGNETVLDAVAELRGLPGGTSKYRMWLARPSGDGPGHQILPVDYLAITRGAATDTNYQLLPGDRVFVGIDPWVALDGHIAKVTSPIERVFGTLLLGTFTVRGFQNQSVNGAGGTGTGFLP